MRHGPRRARACCRVVRVMMPCRDAMAEMPMRHGESRHSAAGRGVWECHHCVRKGLCVGFLWLRKKEMAKRGEPRVRSFEQMQKTAQGPKYSGDPRCAQRESRVGWTRKHTRHAASEAAACARQARTRPRLTDASGRVAAAAAPPRHETSTALSWFFGLSGLFCQALNALSFSCDSFRPGFSSLRRAISRSSNSLRRPTHKDRRA